MTIFPGTDFIRSQLGQFMHNNTVSVRKISGTTTTQQDPRFKATVQNTLAEYLDFKCSFFHILSGKVDRMFGERDLPTLLNELGIFEQDLHVVRYISGQTLSVGKIGTEPPITNNLKVDEELKLHNEWWKVRIVIPDSEGVQHTAIVSK